MRLDKPRLQSVEPVVSAQRHHRAGESKRHSGAWKVAYADFVTALLALFIVLWMMNSSAAVKQSVSGYFHDPRGYTRGLGSGRANVGEGVKIDRKNVTNLQDEIEQALHRMPEFEKIRDNVKFAVTGEGLRIDLLETEQGLFFISGSPDPTSDGRNLLDLLAREVGKMPNELVIEGHTDAIKYRSLLASGKYSNWELSTDRANAARRMLESFGVRPEQVVEVRGYADHKPLRPQNPNDSHNRRISLVVKFREEQP